METMLQSSLVSAMIISGNGFVFSTLALDIFVLLVTFLFTWMVLRPAAHFYIHATSLDKIAKLGKKHWFYGHIKMLGSTTNDHLKSMARISQSFPVMSNVWNGPIISVLNLYHHDAALPLLSSGAPKVEIGYKFIRPWIGDGLLVSKGKKWKRNRQLLTPAFHHKTLKPYTAIFNATAKVLLDKWKHQINTPLEIHEPVSLMTLDTILQCAMSSKTDCQLSSGKHAYIAAVRALSENLTKRFFNPLYLIDWIYKLTSAGRAFYRAADVVHLEAEKIIADRRKTLNKCDHADENKHTSEDFTTTKRAHLDFLDILLQTTDEDGKGLTDKEIRDEVDTFLFEGHDTTASGIAWALYNLAKFPRFQEKCREEVFDVLGTKEDIEWDDLQNLPYLSMFLKESMRLYPPVTVLGRTLDNDMTCKCTLNDPETVIVPKDTITVLNIYTLHRNNSIWPNPNAFDPERFSKENCASRNSHAYLPFSAGQRNCIGQNFAMNEMKVVLSQILRRYRLYLDEETPEPIMETRLILQSRDGIFVKIKPI
ncbi:cytochrome P450 4F1-like [Clavelina lepadiformis]|uniref:cytochrome P450 4F1-like n=1 Tax=Clavelina lepadiformis TaxID=159417 RepID=UPI0040422124